MNTINFIGFGGAGTNIVNAIENVLTSNDMCGVNFETHDASGYSGAGKIAHAGTSMLKGSGGDKRTNMVALREYMAALIGDRPVTSAGTLNVIVLGLGGGSGSNMGTLMVNHMLERKENVLVIAIGDTSSSQYALTTQDTLGDLDLLARKKHNCSLSVMYKQNGMNIEEVNDSIIDDMLNLLIMHSGVTEIDETDMSMFWNQQNYTRITIPPALYKFEVITGEVFPESGVTTARILSDFDSMKGDILQYKIGKPKNDFVREHLDKVGGSVSLVNISKDMYGIMKELKEAGVSGIEVLDEPEPEENEFSIF